MDHRSDDSLKVENRKTRTLAVFTLSTESLEDALNFVHNLIFASGAFSNFNWFRAFEAEEWKDVYQLASDNMATYISAKQKSQEG